MRALEQELALLEPADRRVERADVDAAGGGAKALQDALLVALGLQAADEPAARVRHCLVVEIDRILRRDDHPDPERTGLLHQGEDRLLRGRHRRRRRKAHHLVEIDEPAQLARAGLGVHPGDQAREDERDHELALLLREVREVDHGCARPPVLGTEQHGRVERRPATPGGERGRGHECVQADGELVSVGRRQERVDLEHAELAQRRLLNLPDQRAEVEIGARAPVVLQQVREEDVLAAAERVGLDPDEVQQARDRAFDLAANRLRVRVPRELGCVERADHVQRHARLGAGRVERHLGRFAQRGDPLHPHPVLGETSLPELCGLPRVLVRALARVACGRLVDPGPEARGGEVGEREGEVAHVALRVEDQRRDPLRERLLEQHDPEARLAGTGHPDDHRVGRQVVGVEHELAAIHEPAELEPLTRHGASLAPEPPNGGVRTPRTGDCDSAENARSCSAMPQPPENHQLVATLVCLECGDESDRASGWRAYLADEDELLVYCGDCAAREFDF